MSETVKVISNHHYYELKSIRQMDEKTQDFIKREFNWIDTSSTVTWDECQFFKYRGSWYSMEDFTWIDHPFYGISNKPEWMSEWDSWLNDSFFSGVLIRYARDEWDNIDSDYIQVATFY